MILSDRNGPTTGSALSTGHAEQGRLSGIAPQAFADERHRTARLLSNRILPLPFGGGTGSTSPSDSGIGASLEADEKVDVLGQGARYTDSPDILGRPL